MKKSLFVSRMAAMVLAFGLALAGCPTGGGGGGGGDGTAKKLTITGISGVSGNVRVLLTTNVKKMTGAYLINNHAGVGGTGSIANGSVTISLKVVEFPQGASPSITENDWTGTGNYYIWLWQGDNFSGEPFKSAPVSASWLEKISFSTETITVPWNKFGTSPEISNE